MIKADLKLCIKYAIVQLITLALSVLFSCCCYAQAGVMKTFKTTEYSNGKLYRQTFNTIGAGSRIIDIYFFNKNFYLPYHLPEAFINKNYSNQSISIWRNPKGKKDFQQNWENTYTYDNLGRVVRFTYSGCFVCSSFAYDYTVTYNRKQQITKICNTINTRDSYEFYYDNQGNMVKLEKYSFDKIEEAIMLVY